MNTEVQTEDGAEITGPRFGVSDATALTLRVIGHFLLGAMVCLLIMWLIVKPDHTVMLFVTIVVSTIGVMCEILGWVGGLAAWLLRCLRRILQHFETERVRRGESLFGEFALARQELEHIRQEVETTHKDGEIDRGRVIALLESNVMVLAEVRAEQRHARVERADLKDRLATLERLCRPAPRRKSGRPNQRRADDRVNGSAQGVEPSAIITDLEIHRALRNVDRKLRGEDPD